MNVEQLKHRRITYVWTFAILYGQYFVSCWRMRNVVQWDAWNWKHINERKEGGCIGRNKP